MPTHAGMFSFDGRQAPTTEGWDHTEPAVAMAQRSDDLWLLGRSATLVTLHPPALAMTWDGRLDNRDELLLRLGTDLGSSADPDIALGVFDRWGVDGLKSLVGDWSLVVWDRSHRTLHLARDYMGTRPLYYHCDRQGVAWSSDLAELVARTGRHDALCDAFAAHFICLRPSPDVTPYEGIRAVPAATCVSIAASGRETRTRFWHLVPGQIRYRTPGSYEEHLRALWRDALRARLRTRGTVWAELSGGLDSSSVVCMAHRLIEDATVPAPAIRLVSHATLRSPEGDERRFIAEVERQVGVLSQIVAVEDHQERTDPRAAWVSPYALHGVGLETVRRVRAGGGCLVLSGRMGDAIMGCQPDNSTAVFDDLAHGDLLTALSNMRAWSRATHKPFIEIAWKLFAPAAGNARDGGVMLLTPQLRALLEPTTAQHAVAGVRRSKRDLARMVLDYSNSGRLDVPHHPPGVVYTYPFAHRPLVDFMLAIPGQELSAPGTTRSLMRRAFADLVPPRILRRVSKGYYPPAAFRAARRMAASMVAVDQLQIVQRDWIDPDRLAAALRTLTDGSGETGGDIHRVLRLESWLQVRRDRFSIPERKEVMTNAVLHT